MEEETINKPKFDFKEYINKNKTDSLHKKHWKGISKEIKPSIILMISVVVFFIFLTNLSIQNIFLLIAYLTTGLISSMLIPFLINKCLGGQNGDSYGAGLLITETTNLFLLSFILAPN